MTYGTKNNIPEDFEVIDVADPDWREKIPKSGKILCDKSAYVYAVKFIPQARIARTKEELIEEEVSVEEKGKKEENIAAISSEEILVSAQYHKASEDHRVWLSTYHIKMIEKLLGAGCTITLLDEDNNVVKEVSWKSHNKKKEL